MISKPYSLLPSDLEDGSGVINPESAVTFSFQASGTSPIYMIALEMCDLSDSPSKSIFFAPTSPIYYTNIDGTTKTVEIEASAAQLATIIGSSSEQQWRVMLWGSSASEYSTEVSKYINGVTTDGEFEPNYSAVADWVFVQLKTPPALHVDTETEVSTKSNTWSVEYTPSYAYESGAATTNETPMRSIRWQIYDASSQTLLADTGEIYGCVEPSYSFDGLRDNHTYYAIVTIVDQDGVVTTMQSNNVVVDYSEPSSGILYLRYTNELDGYYFKYGIGQEVVLDIKNFSGADGVSEQGPSGYDIVNMGPPIGYTLANKSGNVISYTGIDDKGATNLTTRFLFTPQAYKADADIGIVYLNDEEDYRVRYAVFGDGGLVPSNTLVPEPTLVPDVRDFYVMAYFERFDGTEWIQTDSYSTPFVMDNYGENDFLYYEHSFTV